MSQIMAQILLLEQLSLYLFQTFIYPDEIINRMNLLSQTNRFLIDPNVKLISVFLHIRRQFGFEILKNGLHKLNRL